MAIITAQKMTKYYNGLRALDGISFSIEQGECFGFLGPNGAGKTTAMRIISCFMPPTGGTVTVFDLDVEHHASAIKARMGVMPQEDNLDPDLSARENLEVYCRYFDRSKQQCRTRSRELLEFVELGDRGDAKIDQLSGGMKRRLLLARSLVNEPEVLMLDEPTTGLDPHSRRAVWDKLNQLKFRNTTLILTTHYMEEAERLCDRVAIMDSGRIVVTDSPANLMAAHGGNLESIYLKLTGRSLAD